jgi:hypothetical protein
MRQVSEGNALQRLVASVEQVLGISIIGQKDDLWGPRANGRYINERAVKTEIRDAAKGAQLVPVVQ